MRIKPELLEGSARETAVTFFDEHSRALAVSEDNDRGLLAIYSFYITVQEGLRGNREVTLTKAVSAPEHGHIIDGPSGDSVSLLFSSYGLLRAIRSNPVGYDRGPSLADRIIPSRRRVAEERVAAKASRLIFDAAQKIEEIGDSKTPPEQSYYF